MPQTGILHIDTQAQERFVIRGIHAEPNGLLIGTVESVSVEAATPSPTTFCLPLKSCAKSSMNTATRISPRRTISTMRCGSVTACPKYCRSSSAQAKLLEMNDSVERLRILSEILKKQIN